MSKLTVGFRRTTGEPTGGSREAAVAVEVNLDGPPAAYGTALTARVAGLFALARQAVAAELANPPTDHAPPAVATATPTRSEPATPTRSEPAKPVLPINRTGLDPRGRPATPNQVKALHGLARRAGLDLKQLVAERFQVRRPDDLAVRQASALIDDLRRAADAHPAA